MDNPITASTEQSSSTDSKEEPEPPDSPAISVSSAISGIKNKFTSTEPAQLGSFFVASERLEIESVSDIGRCRELWAELSCQKTLFDTWEFRYAFYLAYRFLPHFLLLKSPAENLALLPLWYDSDEKKYLWFGSSWQEEVRFFARDPKYIPTLISAAPSPLLLNAISPDSARPVENQIQLAADEPKYVLNLKEFPCHENYLMTLKKNERHSLRKDRRRIERQNPEIIINNFSDFDQLVDLAKKRFADKGAKTDWEDPRRIETFKQVINLSGTSYKARMISVKIGGKTAGTDLVCLFNDTYFTVKCGYNVTKFPGIGNYVNLIEIDDAIKLGMKKIDFLQNNYTWKSRWFEPIPLFKYEKGC